jgi:hypothetical protein
VLLLPQKSIVEQQPFRPLHPVVVVLKRVLSSFVTQRSCNVTTRFFTALKDNCAL